MALGDVDTALVREVAHRVGHGAVGAHLDVADPGSWQRFLAAGIATARGLRVMTAEDVAEVILTAIRTGRAERAAYETRVRPTADRSARRVAAGPR